MERFFASGTFSDLSHSQIYVINDLHSPYRAEQGRVQLGGDKVVPTACALLPNAVTL